MTVFGRFRSQFQYAVLEKWILENFGGPFYLKRRPEVDVGDIFELVACKMFCEKALATAWELNSRISVNYRNRSFPILNNRQRIISCRRFGLCKRAPYFSMTSFFCSWFSLDFTISFVILAIWSTWLNSGYFWNFNKLTIPKSSFRIRFIGVIVW